MKHLTQPDNPRKAAKEGLRIGYITNNASRPASVVAEHLASLGPDVSADDVVTSAQAAAKLIANDFPAGSPVLVVGSEGLTAALEEYRLQVVPGYAALRPPRRRDAERTQLWQGTPIQPE